MKKYDVIAVALYDAVAVIAFALLAAYFGKWWIALFAVLFLCTTKEGEEE